METLFQSCNLGPLTLSNRFVFPPVKTGYGEPGGKVTERQLLFYRQIARKGPGLLILEPVAVTAEGREHPKQLCVHLDDSVGHLEKIARAIHGENRLACLHLNHAGAAANPMVIGGAPKAPSSITCPTHEKTAEVLSEEEIEAIVKGYELAAKKAVEAGFDMLEIQAGHGYLVSQFANGKVNKREDRYGQDRLAFAKEVFSAVRAGAPDLPFMARISGNEMSPEFGIGPDDLSPLMDLAQSQGAVAIHAGMGSSCFSPPWYFHHGSLPEKPQEEALAWVKSKTTLPVVAAGRLGSLERVERMMEQKLFDLAALGRPLIADPDLIEKWENNQSDQARTCGYCLQGCLHRLKNKQPLGCNINPEIGMGDLERTATPLNVLVAGGGPAGLSTAVYLGKRGHKVKLVEKGDQLGGQFELAWRAPGKAGMRQGLEWFKKEAEKAAVAVSTGTAVDVDIVSEYKPDLLVWAAGAVSFTPEIEGLDTQNTMTAVEFFQGDKKVEGNRVLIIGAGRSGLEIAEQLGRDKFEVVATKRTDPIGSMMEMITRKLSLMRIGQMETVTLMPHTAVKSFAPDGVVVEQDGEEKKLAPFQTVILASGMRPCPGPQDEIRQMVEKMEIIGDAGEVQDIFTAVHAGYELALKY